MVWRAGEDCGCTGERGGVGIAVVAPGRGGHDCHDQPHRSPTASQYCPVTPISTHTIFKSAAFVFSNLFFLNYLSEMMLDHNGCIYYIAAPTVPNILPLASYSQTHTRGTGISLRCEELLKGNGISGGAARVLWRKRGLLIGQSHTIFYFIFSCLFKIHNIYYQRGIKGLILGF